MSIKITSKGQDFDPVPAGVHQAVCYGVVDIGTQPNHNPQYKPSRKLVLLFELPFERGDFGERKNAPRGTSAVLTQSLSDKAILRKMLKSWRGKDFTKEELDGFDPKVLIGANAQLNIVHEVKGDKVYANITTIMPLSRGQEKQKQENKSLYFSLDEQDLTNVIYPENMPKWIREKIAFCGEVTEATGGQAPAEGGGWDQDEEAAKAAHAQEQADYAAGKVPTTVVPKATAQNNLNDDVPF